MNLCVRASLCVWSILFTLGGYGQTPQPRIATEADLKADVSLVTCKNEERLAAVQKLFSRLGSPDAELKIEKLGKVENLVVNKKGKTDEIVIVGAHYDKTSEGCGAIDNWTGIVILANLYRTMSDFTTNKTYVFAAFGKEEIGLIGSNAMANAIPKEARTNYCAMINFDSFGFTQPQAVRNISDESLIKLAGEVSKEMKMPFGSAAIENASSDSESFRRRGIPAISLHGLPQNWQSYLHSSSDKVSNVNTQSVYIGYRHALVMLSKIDQMPCGSFRK